MVMRLKLAEQEEARRSFDVQSKLPLRKLEVDKRIVGLGGEIVESTPVTDYAFRYRIKFGGEWRKFADYIEDVDGVEILSLGSALELIKDLGEADQVADQYQLRGFKGTHAIGHTRMATESDVDIRSAHPYWAYPFADVSVVHNGQLPNYWMGRRALEHRGHRGRAAGSAYACAKAGVWMLTRVLAQELWRDNISVNELIPGPVRSDIGPQSERSTATSLGESEWVKTPDDVVPLALFLAIATTIALAGLTAKRRLADESSRLKSFRMTAT
jgi:hypothetical protein